MSRIVTKHLSMAALVATGALTLAGVPSANATTTVATIVGAYDLSLGNTSSPEYDTPALIFSNTSGGTLTNAQMVLKGYQGLNNGVTLTVPLANMGAGSTTLVWGRFRASPIIQARAPPETWPRTITMTHRATRLRATPIRVA